MIDLTKDIAALLSPIAHVESEFPDTNQSFPLFTISQIDNSSAVVIDGAERYSRYEFQLDTWDTPKNGRSALRCVQLSVQANEALTLAGFTRGNGKQFKDPGNGLHRNMAPYVGYVDNVTGLIYRKI